ncbi:glycosyltransferase [Streptomyces sp. TRM43335]|uniref:D-inositol 3-phosphate glycosyltransferase n=1 Tax=Streptomyces taklimakanensis TaxID=2569853 RepID=A0A6G2BHT5_9ACTN|nr:glycosyltransferase [Streptomyces taklimakanensis]MTE21810.1 glycosyltransferase [Streptomyces taklimakanensis]
MRVLHVITGLGAGGAEQQLRLLLRHLPLCCDVVTLTNPGAVADGIEADGTAVTHLGMHGNRDLSALPRLVDLVRGGRYDVVHTHLYRACVYGRIAARLAGTRTVVATEHSIGERMIEGRPLTPGNRALYLTTERLGSATVAVSTTVAARLRRWGVPGSRIRVIPNGIDAARFRFDPVVRASVRTRLGLPAHSLVVGGVGRLVPGKRFDVAVRAVAQLPGTHLVLAGDGPERGRLRELAVGLGVADRVRFLGECGGAAGDDPGAAPDIPGLLSAMDVFVSPSVEESFGLAVLEALAAGLPVLHVTCPAIDELPHDHAPGARRIAPDVRSLVTALREPSSVPAGRRRAPVCEAVRRYDVARSADRLMALYEELHERAPARASVRAATRAAAWRVVTARTAGAPPTPAAPPPFPSVSATATTKR